MLRPKLNFSFKKSQFCLKSRFKESKCADGGYSLNRDFTVYYHRLFDDAVMEVSIENS